MNLHQITLEEAQDAYQWAVGHHSYNDNDRYVLFMQALGFGMEDLAPPPPITITKDQLYRAIDGHPCDVPEDFTDLVWQYLKEIIEEERKVNENTLSSHNVP